MKRICVAPGSAFLLLVFVAFVQAQSSTQAHWPQWRGPFFNGLARGDAPTDWNDTKNIKWKANIPGRGFSTPVIWGDRIFLTTAVPTGKPAAQPTVTDQASTTRRVPGDTGPQAEQRFDVLCLDRRTGKLLWQKTAKVAVPHEGYHRVYGSFASNSPSTDGRYVYVSFGSRGIFCYDFNGKLIWEKDLGVQMKMRLAFGEGSAPLLMADRLIAVFDHESGSFIVALDKRTGKELWRLADGVDVKIPTPIVANDLYFLGGGSSHERHSFLAVRAGVRGEIKLSETDAKNIAWQNTQIKPHIVTPIVYRDYLYVCTDNGIVSQYQAKTGEPTFRARLGSGGSFSASPVAADGKLYFFSEDGDVFVIKADSKFELLARNAMGEVVMATPAIGGNMIIVRGQNHLFGIGAKD